MHCYQIADWDYQDVPGLTRQKLRRDNLRLRGSGGLSQENHQVGFQPAFFDSATDTIYPSCFANGCPAPFHCLDGLPTTVVISKDAAGHVCRVKPTVSAGFVRDSIFYSREQAARVMAAESGEDQ